MQDEKNKRTLYNTLVADNYELGTFEDFSKNVEDETKRKNLYNALEEDNYELDDFETFSQKLVGNKTPSTSEVGSIANEVVQEVTGSNQSNKKSYIGSYGATNPNIIDPLAKEQPVIPTTPAVQEETQASATPVNKELTGQERVNAFAKQMEMQAGMNKFKSKIDKDLNAFEVASKQNTFNPTVQKVGDEYVDALGNRHTSELEAIKTNQELSKMYAQSPNTSLRGRRHEIESKIENSNKEYEKQLSEIEKQIADRQNIVREEHSKKINASTDKFKSYRETQPDFSSDTKLVDLYNLKNNLHKAHKVELHNLEQSLERLNRQVDKIEGNEAGFWKGALDKVTDSRTWDFGLQDLDEALIQNNFNENYNNLSQQEKESVNKMLEAIYRNQFLSQEYQDSKMYGYGEMLGVMPSFAVDLFTGAGLIGKGIKIGTKVGTKLATKAVGKEVAEDIAEKGTLKYIQSNGLKGAKDIASQNFIKFLGQSVDDIAKASIVTAVPQGMKTGAGIIDRKLGNVVEDEQGNLKFEDEKSWNNAIYNEVTDRVVEAFSEMFGGHLGKVTLKEVGELAGAVGAKKIGSALLTADAKMLDGSLKKIKDAFSKVGINDLSGEALEEYYGQLWRTILNQEDAYITNPDGSKTNLLAVKDFHVDLVVGLGLTMGAMKSVQYPFTAIDYIYTKNKVRKAGNKASVEVGAEKWKEIKQLIDNATNQDVSKIIADVFLKENISGKGQLAVLDYVAKTAFLRGYNIGELSQNIEQDLSEVDKTLAERKRRENENYFIGHNATGEQKVDIKDRYEASRERLEELGISTDTTEGYSDLYALAEEFQRNRESAKANAVYNFIDLDNQYRGLIITSAGDVDNEIEINNYIIDNRVNQDTGKIIKAKDIQGEEVYVVKGNVRVNEQGEAEIIGGDSVVIQKADGTQEMVSLTDLAEFEEIDPEQLKEESNATIKQTLTQQKADEIEGIVPLQVGMQVQGLGVISAIDEQGNVAIQIEGKEEPAIIPYNSVQALLQQARVDAIKQEQAQEEQAQPIEETPQQINAEDIGLGFTANVNGETLEVVGIYEDKFMVDYQGKILPRTREEIAEIVNNAQPVEETAEQPAEEVAETKENNTENNKEKNAPNEKIIGQNADNQSVEIGKSIGNEVSKKDADYLNLGDVDAWNTIVAECNGDVETANEIVNEMIEDADKTLQKIKNAKLKRGNSVAEKIAIRNEHAQNIANAEAVLEKWKAIANVPNMQPVAEETAQPIAEVEKQVEEIPQTEEVDEYGNHFVLASDGTDNFGVIDAESGLKSAPIKLSIGDNTIDEKGNNHGYGLLHIEAERGDAIRKAGYNSIQEFVESVAKNYTDIREGGVIANNQTYLLELVDEHNNTLFIQLSKNGEYWTINSAGIFRKKYSRNKRKVYNRPAVGSGTNTDTSGVHSGLDNGVTTPAGNSPQTSDSKDTTNSKKVKSLEQENETNLENEEVVKEEKTLQNTQLVKNAPFNFSAYSIALEKNDTEEIAKFEKNFNEFLQNKGVDDIPLFVDAIKHLKQSTYGTKKVKKNGHEVYVDKTYKDAPHIVNIISKLDARLNELKKEAEKTKENPKKTKDFTEKSKKESSETKGKETQTQTKTEVVKEENPVKQRLQELRKEYASETNMFERVKLREEVSGIIKNEFGVTISFGEVDTLLEASEEDFADLLSEIEKGNNPIKEFEQRKESLSKLSEKENARRQPLRKRAKEWEEKVGVKVRIIESVDEVGNKKAKQAIKAGRNVAGWYDVAQNEVYIYLPNITSEKEIDNTYLHEVVAHKGLRELLGQEKFDALCDRVWNSMSKEAQEEYAEYVGAKEKPTQKQQRAAADEYMASLAEKTNLTEEEKNIWNKLVDWVKEVLSDIFNTKLTNEQIQDLIRASYQNLMTTSNNQEITTTSNNEEVKEEPIVNSDFQLIMSDAEFQTLIASKDKERMKKYVAQIEKSLIISEKTSPFASKEYRKVEKDIKEAIKKYGSKNIPDDLQQSLLGRRRVFDDLSENLYNRLHSLENRLRELESIEETKQKKETEAQKTKHKETAYNGFLANKNSLMATNAEKVLSKEYNFNIQGKKEVLTVAEFVERAVKEGVELEIRTSPKYSGVSNRTYNRMSSEEQKADDLRVKNSGVKKEYFVNDVNLGKTAYDYATYLQNLNQENLDDNDYRFRITPAEDKAYMEAVEKGDLETAQRMVNEVAERTGYNADSKYQGSLAFNGAAPSSNAYFETKEERKEAWENGDFEGDMSLGDFVDNNIDTHDLEWRINDPRATMNEGRETIESIRNLRDVVRNKKRTIKMYRAVDADIKENSFRNGDWITPSRSYAKYHVTLQDWKRSRIIEQEVSIDDIWWNGDDINEWGFDDGKDYGYKNTKNNRKLLDAVTYDDNGNVIPLSKRFNKRNANPNFAIGKGLQGNSQAFKKATEKTMQQLKNIGIDVQMATEEQVNEVLGLAELHKKKSSLETASVQEEHQPTVVSSDDTAKILQNIKSTIKEYENKSEYTKTFVGDIAKVLGAKQQGSNSQYATFVAKNGKEFTIRLADHNARVSTFDNHNEKKGISIVITAKGNKGITNNGNAHVVEFFYDAIKLRKADNKPLVQILKSIEQTLYSGEYKDTTGLAEVQEVNNPQFMIAYHGSGAKFDKFDHSFMGTATGVPMFGYGTYVAQIKNTAKMYARGFLYRVEIPNDNGTNYLHYGKIVPTEEKERVKQALFDTLAQQEEYQGAEKELKDELDQVFSEKLNGDKLYGTISSYLGGSKEASQFLNSLGYIGSFHQITAKKGNYVIFNENYIQIKDRFEFMKTPQGTIYGWTIGGKIFLTKAGVNPNTPVHEYTHLWAEAMRQTNPKMWNRIVEGLKSSPTWSEVKADENYSDISNSDDLVASEVLSRLSGKENYNRLMEQMQKDIDQENGVFEKAEKISLLEDIKKAFNDFWNWVLKTFTNKPLSVEQAVNMPLNDFWKGVNPNEAIREEENLPLQRMFVGEKGARGLDRAEETEDIGREDQTFIFDSLASEEDDIRFRELENEELINEQFNKELQQQIDGTLPKGHIYQLGMPSDILLSAGFPYMPIELSSTNLAEHAKKTHHTFELNDVKGLVNALQEPIAVFTYGDKNKSQNVIVEIQKEGRNFLVGVHFNQERNGLEVSSIRGIFPKNNAEWLNWIAQGKSLYLNKEKIQTLVDQQRKTLADVEYLDLDSVAKIVQNFENPSFSDNISERQGGKTYTDEELSYENDPIAKVLGKPRYSLPQTKAFAKRQRERMLNHAVGMIEKLHLDNVEIVTDVETLQGKRKKAKGFYNTTTGKITIVMPNHTDIYDVQETILHEAVAHYGLRKLFGEHFDTFLDNVYNNASQEVREQIVELANKNYWDFAKATEEYLASLAETTNFEDAVNTSWWQKIKDLFVNMLRKLGLNDFRGETLTDNELRYILWRSYQNLIDPNAYRNPFAVAEDVVMQDELKVGNYATVNEERTKVAEEEVLFREQQGEENSIERYNRKINNGAYQSYEAFADSMASVKAVMEQATGEKIRDIAGHENAYLGENALSSANKAQIDWATERLFKPLYKVVHSLAKNEEERNELMDYLFAKHGLERNEKMRADVEEANKKAIEKTNKINEELKADYTRRIIAGEEVGELKLQEPKLQKTNRDFAGLIGLTGIESVNGAEEKAKQIVGEYEDKFNTTELWEKINAITKETLKKSLDSGIISPETYNKISSMYKYYIPLRGFDETTAEDMFSYLTNQEFGRFTPAFIKARGRRSKADNPFAFMESMYESAVLQGNRNTMVKQRFLNFVNNHPSELFSVSKDLWLQYDVEENAWKPVFAKIEDGDSAEVIKKKTAEFEKEMRQKAKEQPDSYKNASEGSEKLPYKFEVKSNKHQHQIIVKQNGKDIVITVNGNPRVAQAINGLANPDNDFSGASGAILSGTQNIGRYLSTMYTSASLDFLIKNFIRDSFYSNFMAWVRENPKYALRFNGNYLRFFVENLLRFISGNNLFRKWRKGTLNRDNKVERLFEEFMLHGGETGYVELKNIEEHKKEIAKKIKKSKDAWKVIMYQLASVNRVIENNARFAAYYTSRNMGRDIARSVYDAKEISVNFNKKGAGSKFLNATGQTALGKASAFTSGAGRSLYIFWNPAIQGLAQFLRAFREHPIKSSVLTATAIGAGIATAWWLSGDDEEEEKYYNIPERIRRQNIIIPIGENYLALPLPIEFRAFYGLGELLYSVTSGKEYMTSGEFAMNIAEQFSQVLPINFLEGESPLMQLVPSAIKPIVEVGRNESWTGLPIYKDDSFGGIVEGHKPEYQNVYKNANPTFVMVSKQINDWTGGDDVKEGGVDINPAIVEHLAKGYLGGIFSLSNDITNLIYTALGDREFDVRDVPAFGAVVAKADERTQYRAVNNRYYEAKKEADEIRYLKKGYDDLINKGNNEYNKVLEELKKTPEYKRFEIFENARKGAEGIDKLNRELKKATEKNNEKRMEELNTKLYLKKKEMLNKWRKVNENK